MNMKKLMAVVLAVVLAVSAMAINVFAAEGEVHQIPLRPNQSQNYNVTANYELTVPMYNMYGYADYNHYLELYLPNTFTNDTTIHNTVNWYVEASGAKVLVASMDNYQYGKPKTDGIVAYKNDGTTTTMNYNDVEESKNGWSNPLDAKVFEKVYVNFGAFKRDWNQWSSGDDHWATVPQTVSFNTTDTIKLIAEVKLPEWTNTGWNPTFDKGQFESWGKYAGKLYIQLWSDNGDNKEYGAGNDLAITGSKVWAKGMTTTAGKDASSSLKPFEFISNEATKTYVDLTWDMTLVNRSYIMNADSVDLVVKFHQGGENNWMAPTTYGTAMYRLYMADSHIDYYPGQNWLGDGSGYNRVFNEIAYQNVNAEEISELRFAISPEKLVNHTYGFSAGMTSTFRIFAQYEQPANSFFSNQNNIHYNHWSNNAYLEVTMPAEDDSTEIDVPDPVQSGDDETIDGGDDEVNVGDDTPTTPVEPEDTNPPTGIVLAVLPMVVAAAAVVASKRR